MAAAPAGTAAEHLADSVTAVRRRRSLALPGVSADLIAQASKVAESGASATATTVVAAAAAAEAASKAGLDLDAVASVLQPALASAVGVKPRARHRAGAAATAAVDDGGASGIGAAADEGDVEDMIERVVVARHVSDARQGQHEAPPRLPRCAWLPGVHRELLLSDQWQGVLHSLWDEVKRYSEDEEWSDHPLTLQVLFDIMGPAFQQYAFPDQPWQPHITRPPFLSAEERLAHEMPMTHEVREVIRHTAASASWRRSKAFVEYARAVELKVLRAATRETDVEHLQIVQTPAEVLGAAVTSILTGTAFTAPETDLPPTMIRAGKARQAAADAAFEAAANAAAAEANASSSSAGTGGDASAWRVGTAGSQGGRGMSRVPSMTRVIGSRKGKRSGAGAAAAGASATAGGVAPIAEADVEGEAEGKGGDDDASNPLALSGLLSLGIGGLVPKAESLEEGRKFMWRSDEDPVNEEGFLPVGGSDIAQPMVLARLRQAVRGRSLPNTLRPVLWRHALCGSQAAITRVDRAVTASAIDKGLKSAGHTVLAELIRRTTVLTYAEDLRAYKTPGIVSRTTEVLNRYYTFCHDHSPNYVLMLLPLLLTFPHLDGTHAQLVCMLHSLVTRCGRGLTSQKHGGAAALRTLDLVAQADPEYGHRLQRCMSGLLDVGSEAYVAAQKAGLAAARGSADDDDGSGGGGENNEDGGGGGAAGGAEPKFSAETQRASAWQLLSPWLETLLVGVLRQEAAMFCWDQCMLHDGWKDTTHFLRLCAALLLALKPALSKVKSPAGLRKAVRFLPRRLYTRDVRAAVNAWVLEPMVAEEQRQEALLAMHKMASSRRRLAKGSGGSPRVIGRKADGGSGGVAAHSPLVPVLEVGRVAAAATGDDGEGDGKEADAKAASSGGGGGAAAAASGAASGAGAGSPAVSRGASARGSTATATATASSAGDSGSDSGSGSGSDSEGSSRGSP